MDETTSSGMSPEKVADNIVKCLISGHEEMMLAPLSHQMAVILRTLSPSLISRIMKRRATTQRNAYTHKKE